jgi:hypothetical protein
MILSVQTEMRNLRASLPGPFEPPGHWTLAQYQLSVAEPTVKALPLNPGMHKRSGASQLRAMIVTCDITHAARER